MRMRKKKYLDERIDAVSDYILDTKSDERDFNKAIEEKEGMINLKKGENYSTIHTIYHNLFWA